MDGNKSRKSLLRSLWVVVMVLSACASSSGPILTYETPHEAIGLQFDPQAGDGHSHPSTIAPDQLARVLQGIRVTNRDTFGMGGFFSKTGSVPAFTASQVALLAQRLTEALSIASPRDVATFYLITSDPSLGKLITSGGVYLRGSWVHLILANFHTPPSAGPFEGMAYEIDNRNDPLFPLARFRFTVQFISDEAVVDRAKWRRGEYRRRYVDESKILVVDLDRLLSDVNRDSP